MFKKKSVVFAMRYADSVGYIWSNRARLYDAVAERLVNQVNSWIAYPNLTGYPAVTLRNLNSIAVNLYDTSKSNKKLVEKFIVNEKIKVIVYFGCDAAEVDIPYLHSLGVKTVNCDGNGYDTMSRQSFLKWLAKAFIRRTLAYHIHDMYVANTYHLKKFLLRHAVLPPDRVKVILNGINTALFEPGPVPDHIAKEVPKASKYVISVCQARPEKKIDFLIDVAKSYIERFTMTDVIFIHIGGGAELSNWISRADGLGISSRFIFLGEKKEIASFMKLGTLYVHCCNLECFGNSIAEAMATGIPVVAIDSPGARGLLRDDIGGKIIQEFNIDEFVNTIHRYLSSEQLLNNTGVEGRKRIKEQYSVIRQVDQLASAIVSIM